MSWRAVTILVVSVVSVCAFPRGNITPPPTEASVQALNNEDEVKNLDDIVKEGYPAELHQVTTDDGYILGVHRIPYGKDGPTEGRRPVAFLMHGLMGQSRNFIYLRSEAGIAYNLADAGYDVWMGNARGNINSRAHVSLNPDDGVEKFKFFEYSWEEIGMIDLPAMVDYVLGFTGEEKLHYIGHSQGGTAFLVLNSMKPQYNERFISAHLLAGVGYMGNFPNLELRTVSLLTNSIYSLGVSMGLVEISSLDDLPLPQRGQTTTLTQYNVFRTVLGLDGNFGNLVDVGLGGAALKQFAHYGQNIRDKAFRRWDYGLLDNRRIYGTLIPPSYDLSRITVDVTMHYTVSDALLDEKDVLAMAAVMPNAEARKVARETFSHIDFIQAADAKQLVNDYIIEKLNSAEKSK